MMKRSFLVLFFAELLMTLPVTGQLSSFRISDYKLPDIRFRKLDLSASLTNSRVGYALDYQSDSASSFGSASTGGTVNASWSYFRNSEKYQGDWRIRISASPDISLTREGGEESSTSFLRAEPEIRSVNRFYLTERFFIGSDPSFYGRRISYSSRNDYEGGVNSEWKDNGISFTIPLAAGFGRIEPVANARHAVYVIEQLEDNGRLKRIPADETVLELARLISKLKYKRIFDSRLRKIEELHAVDSFLIANDLVNESDVTYFTGLNDIWEYGEGPSRNSGNQLSGGLRYRLAFGQYRERFFYPDDTAASRNFSRTNTPGIFISYKRSVPSNLSWQHDLSIGAGYDHEISNRPEDFVNVIPGFRSDIFYVDAEYSIAFIPDTRSYFKLTAGGSVKNYGGLRFRETESGRAEGRVRTLDLSMGGSADFVYYFSPRLTASLRWVIGYRWINTNLQLEGLPGNDVLYRYLDHNLRLNLIYSIF